MNHEKLHTVGLDDMKELAEEYGVNGAFDDVPLVFHAADEETLRYLHFAGAQMIFEENPVPEDLLTWAASNKDLSLVNFLSSLEYDDDQRVSAVDYIVCLDHRLFDIVKAIVGDRKIDFKNSRVFRILRYHMQTCANNLFAGKRCDRPANLAIMKSLRETMLFLIKNTSGLNKSSAAAAVEGDFDSVNKYWHACKDYNRLCVAKSAAEFGYVKILEFAMDRGVKADYHVINYAVISGAETIGYLMSRSDVRNNTDLVDHAIESAMSMDAEDSLAEIMDKAVTVDYKVRGHPLLVVAKSYVAKECFKLLLRLGVAPYHDYPKEYRQGEEIRPMSKQLYVVEDADVDFFDVNIHVSAAYLNEKAKLKKQEKEKQK